MGESFADPQRKDIVLHEAIGFNGGAEASNRYNPKAL
jgi:hypothetical protein